MTLVQTEPKKIYYGEPIIVSDMQGPCPDGFHVPLNSEWQALYNVGVSLGAWSSSPGNNFKTYLKLPMAGYRMEDSGRTGDQGAYGEYRASNAINNNAYGFVFSSSYFYPTQQRSRAEGMSIRGFKNSPVIPTSSWTKLYGTSIESGGIFWSSTAGLISISSDGQTWITIADKNVGATTVYNSGDTVSEANCGKYFQWGNNYGFPFTGTVTTSNTQVNASDYGPGNYYSSSTFIYRASSPYSWDSSNNTNLRGGVSQGTSEKAKEIKAVYLGENKVRPVGPTYETVTDSTNASWNRTGSTSSYYYGVKFTALKSGRITKVTLMYEGNSSGTLKIAEGYYASYSGDTYSYSTNSSGEYTLDTPFEITEGNNYVVSINTGSSQYLAYQNGSGGYPITGTAVRYDYSTYSGNNSSYTNVIYAIKSLTIEYTP